jgi:hypothetical protein
VLGSAGRRGHLRTCDIRRQSALDLVASVICGPRLQRALLANTVAGQAPMYELSSRVVFRHACHRLLCLRIATNAVVKPLRKALTIKW